LADALWPTTIVEDNNLSQVVAALRRALGDTQDVPRFVATVPRRGYQFVGAVRETDREESVRVPATVRAVPWNRLYAVGVLVVAAAAAGWLVSRNDASGGGEEGFARAIAPGRWSAVEPTTSLEAYAAYSQAVALYRASGGIGVGMPLPVRETLTSRPDEAPSH